MAVENARIIPLDPAQPRHFEGHLLVDGQGAVEALGPGPLPPGSEARRRIDAGGRWLMPGFVSAHSHLWQSGYAGLCPDCGMSCWSTELYGRAAGLTPEQLFDLTLAGARGHLRSGITTAFNFTYTGADRTGAIDRAQFEAAGVSGIRFIHGLNAGRFDEGWDIEKALRRARDFLAWADGQGADGRYLRTMIAGQGTYFESGAQAAGEAALMRSLSLRNHLHYLEAPETAEVERARFAWLEDNGMIGPGMIFGHFIHVTPEILGVAASSGAGMSWNPLSNGRLGSGVPDIPAYLRAGLRIGMGVDGQASSDRPDPFENMRHGLYSVRSQRRDAGILGVDQVLHMHTLGAAELLGVADRVGSLAPGKQADFILLDPPVAHDADPLAAIVLAAGVEHISGVHVGGVAPAGGQAR